MASRYSAEIQRPRRGFSAEDVACERTPGGDLGLRWNMSETCDHDPVSKQSLQTAGPRPCNEPELYRLTGSAKVLLVLKLADPLAGRMEILRLHPRAQCEIAKRQPDFLERQRPGWPVPGESPHHPRIRDLALAGLLPGGAAPPGTATA